MLLGTALSRGDDSYVEHGAFVGNEVKQWATGHRRCHHGENWPGALERVCEQLCRRYGTRNVTVDHVLVEGNKYFAVDSVGLSLIANVRHHAVPGRQNMAFRYQRPRTKRALRIWIGQYDHVLVQIWSGECAIANRQLVLFERCVFLLHLAATRSAYQRQACAGDQPCSWPR
jgi:hypothetical protein